MYMRFVHLKVKEGRLWDLARFYEERIIPALQETEGCLFVSLLQATGEDDESISMTVWSSQEHAEAYEKSGLYDQFLDEGDEFLAEAAQWRVRLAGGSGGAVPPLQDPEVEAFPVEVAALSDRRDDFSSRRLFMRIVSARVKAGRLADFRERWDKEVKPQLLATQGCRAVFLVEGIKARPRILSVTVWDREEDAVRYEISGAFDENTARLKEFMSGLFQWNLQFPSAGEHAAAADRGLDVSSYQLVTGRRLRD